MVDVTAGAGSCVFGKFIRKLSCAIFQVLLWVICFYMTLDVAQAGCVSSRCASPLLVISSPANNASFRSGQAITISGRAYGDVVYTSNGDERVFPISRVEIYLNGGVVGNATLGAGGVNDNDIPYRDYSYTFSAGFVGGGNYAIGAKPYDTGSNAGAAAGAVSTITVAVAANASPTISIISPAEGSVLTEGSVVRISSAASDYDGTITGVQYFIHKTPISGVLTVAPYNFDWTVTGAGQINAVATDNNGASTETAIWFTLNDRPVSQLNVSNVVSQNPGSITLTANASDRVGGVSHVQYFRNGGQQSPNLYLAPFMHTWSGVPPGTYTIVARTYDAYGIYTDSAPYAWIVNEAPTVALAAPANGSIINLAMPGNITLAANAFDNDDGIAKVEFLINGSVVGTSTGAPFTAQWSVSAAGVYMVQARATDTRGASNLSAISMVTVNALPVATITSPANGASFLPGANIPVAIGVASNGFTISKVEIYDGTNLVGTALGAPYSITMVDVSAGSHVLTARAYYEGGAFSTSAPVTLNVVFVEPPESSGSGTPGKLRGTLDVASSGSAQYTIPITIPPGTAGMQPNLALKYDSSVGNGVMGMGWSISGISQITRCARDIAHDGASSAIELSAADRFCLDGQRLIVTNGLAYGAPNSEYRTEIDSFSKIVALGTLGNGPASFVVTLRNGVRLEYGSTPDSRLILFGHTTPVVWSANKVSDPRGNYYTIIYALAGNSGQQLPSQVDYTGNLFQANAPATYNSVRFIYDQSRSDIETGYLAGAKVSNSFRLSNVQTYAGAMLVKDYRIAYDGSPLTARSRVLSITECADTSITCLPPTTFNWESTPANFSGPVVEYPVLSAEFGELIKGDYGGEYWPDLNGDGRPEHCAVFRRTSAGGDEYVIEDLLCSMSQPGSTTPVPVKVSQLLAYSSYSFIDANGDGINDVCTEIYCLISGQDGTTWTPLSIPGVGSLGLIPFLTDLNGDGKIDYCRLTNDGVKNAPFRLECYLGNGTSFGPAMQLETFSIPKCEKSGCESLRFSWVDVTGDGIQSFCRLEASSMRCRKWTPTGLAAEISSGVIDIGEKYGGRDWVDVNGDGLADFCRVISNTPGQPGAAGHLACTLSTGTGFGETIVSVNLDIGNSTENFNTRKWLDLNGDGKADYCRDTGWPLPSKTECLISTGMGFSVNIPIPNGGGSDRIADVNGDGKADACGGYIDASGSMMHSRCLTSAGTYPDVLQHISDGLGQITMLTYKPLSDATVYAKGSGAVFPVSDVQNSSHVVQRVRTSNGSGDVNDVMYSYAGARVDLQGRGFLGFQSVSSVDPAGIVSRNVFRQDFPYTGLVSQTQISKDGVFLSEQVTDYGAKGTAAYQIYPTRTTSKTRDLNGVFLNWIEKSILLSNIDAWGNPLQIDTLYKNAAGTSDGYSLSTVINYYNDTENWILGQWLRLQTTNRIPSGTDSTRTISRTYFTSNPGLGLLKQHIVEPENGGSTEGNLRLVTDYTYDKFGNVLNETVSGANIVTRTARAYSYDVQGRGPMSVRNALNHLEAYEYDWRFGLIKSRTDPNVLITSWGYDAFGRQISETRADGTRTTLDYHICRACAASSAYSVSRSEIAIASGANVSPPSRIYYDTLGRAILSVGIGFDGRKIYRETEFDYLGRVAYTAAPHFAGDARIRWTKYQYDALGRLIQTTAPDNSRSSVDYNGRTTSTINANSVASSRSVNSQGRVVAVTDAVGTADASAMSYAYDHWGNLVGTTDAAGNRVTIDYDLAGRKVRLADPDMGTRNYRFDNLGQLISQTDAKGQTTSYAYDVLGRMTRRLESDHDSHWYYETDASGVACVKGIGKLCEANSSNGYSRRYAYDSIGRLSSQTSRIDTDYVTRWSYDAAGRLGSRTFPATTALFAAPLAINYNYSSVGLLQSITNTASGAAYWTRNAENADGNVISETYGNGLTATRGYDALTGRLVKLQAGTSGVPNAVQDQAYHYDSLGRLDQRQDNAIGVGTSEIFAYDNLNRQTHAIMTVPGVGLQSASTGFNAIGNILGKTGVGSYVYAAGGKQPHAVMGINGSLNGVVNPVFSYDNNGNMLTDGARSFTWTSFDMPATLTKSAQVGSPGSGVSTFLYGPEHQRLRQTWSDGSKSVTT
ncbi:Ig-like domain-containing protein, partial [Janthinobacterium agaricidamnosum]